jgi:Zn ribbon nucleic-acid-binding protein
MRVERALAEVPFDGIGGLDSRATGLGRTAHAASWAPPAAPAEGGAACPVCRSSQLVRDEVLMAGNLFHLVECLHCDHRFTSAPGTSGAHGRASVSAPGAAPPQGGRGDPGAGGLREIVDAVAMG